VDTGHLFSQVVAQKQFWGILGAEDAGKSTFIKVNINQHTIISIYHVGPSIGA
jgi:ABC-type multidrug transport system ATPase subunit